MSKKKSLGHNPLAYSTRRHASFDFIAPSAPEKEETESDESTAQIQPQKKVTQPSNNNDDSQVVNKVTASYYLEEPLVLKIRAMADEQNTSYSAIVNEMLKELLNTQT